MRVVNVRAGESIPLTRRVRFTHCENGEHSFRFQQTCLHTVIVAKHSIVTVICFISLWDSSVTFPMTIVQIAVFFFSIVSLVSCSSCKNQLCQNSINIVFRFQCHFCFVIPQANGLWFSQTILMHLNRPHTNKDALKIFNSHSTMSKAVKNVVF